MVIPGTSAIVNYLFLTETLDVELTVTLDDGSETVTIVDPEHIAHVKSTLAVNRAHAASMKLNFRLSNAFSWFTDKKISYKIEAWVPRLRPTVLDALRRLADARAARDAAANRVSDASVKRKEAQGAVNTLGEQLAALEAALASAVASLEAAKKEVVAADSAQSSAACDWSVRALTATLTIMLTGSQSSHEALLKARAKAEGKGARTSTPATATAAAGAEPAVPGDGAADAAATATVAVSGAAPSAASTPDEAAAAAAAAPASAASPAVALALAERIGYLSPQDVCSLVCSCKSALMLLGSHADGLRRAAGQPSAAERSRARAAARAAALDARDAAERAAAAAASDAASAGSSSAAGAAPGTPLRSSGRSSDAASASAPASAGTAAAGGKQPQAQELIHHPTAAAMPFTPMPVSLPAALAASISIADTDGDAHAHAAAHNSGGAASAGSASAAAQPPVVDLTSQATGDVVIRPGSGSGAGGALVISFADEDILAPVTSPSPSHAAPAAVASSTA